MIRDFASIAGVTRIELVFNRRTIVAMAHGRLETAQRDTIPPPPRAEMPCDLRHTTLDTKSTKYRACDPCREHERTLALAPRARRRHRCAEAPHADLRERTSPRPRYAHSAGDTVPVHTHRWPAVYNTVSFSHFIRRDGDGNVLFDSRTLVTPLSPAGWLDYTAAAQHRKRRRRRDSPDQLRTQRLKTR